MKRFTVFFAMVGVLVFWAGYQAHLDKWSEVKSASNLPRVYDATGEMLKAVNTQDDVVAIPVTGAESVIPLVYDATGAMLDAINPKKAEVTSRLPIVYDATGAMLEAINP